MVHEDTIVALSSAPGAADRAIIRLSGPKAFAVARRLTGRAVRRRGCFDATIGGFRAALWVMPGPRSYTREDVVEIHVAGAEPVARDTVERCLKAGARPAEPGEFTRRAFLNGRLNLAQAEAVQAVIASRSRDELHAAVSLLRGAYARELRAIEESLLTLCADVEAAIDFVDQDIEIVAPTDALKRAQAIAAELDALLSKTTERRVADRRPRVFIYGAPNAGKSALFNRLTQGRAIVSPVAGTTRDVLAGECDGVTLLDAPGIFEGEGIDATAVERARAEAESADAWMLVVDASKPSIPPGSGDRATLKVASKMDLGVSSGLLTSEWMFTSAVTGEGLGALRAKLREFASGGGSEAAGARFALSVRQHRCLRGARADLERATSALAAGLGMEFVALDLRASLESLGAVTGRHVNDDLLDRIFERFCVGK